MTQPTLAVTDANNVKQTIFTANQNGQANLANSQPVALASDTVLPLPIGAATEATLLALKTAQHTDLQALLTAVGVTNSDLVALTTAQHVDLTALVTKIVAGGATDANVSAFASTNHADLVGIATAIGITNTDLIAMTSANHNDMVNLLARLVTGGATDAMINAVGATNHADAQALLTAIGATNTAVATLATANHTDLTGVLAKMVAGAATDANLTAIGTVQHADLVSIVAAIGVTNADIVAAMAANHTDLTALINKVPVLPSGTGEIDHSGTIAVAGTAQTIMQTNTFRKYFELQNLDPATPLWFRKDGLSATIGPGSLSLAAGGFYSGQSIGAVSIISTLAGHQFTALEGSITLSAAIIATAPVIVGTPTVGVPLTITAGSFTGGNPTATITRVIYAGNTQVATGSTYTPVAADAGKIFTVDDIATNAAGATHNMSGNSAACIVLMSLAARAQSGSAALTITPASGDVAATVYTVTSTQGSVLDLSAGTAAQKRLLTNMTNDTAYTLTVTSSVAGQVIGTATTTVTPTAVAQTKTVVFDKLIIAPNNALNGVSTLFVDVNRTRAVLRNPITNTESFEIAPSNQPNNHFDNYNANEIYVLAPGQEIEMLNDTRRVMSRILNNVASYNQKLLMELEITL